MIGLVQSLLVAACLGVTMGIRLIPSAVLWGYFAFMALESLSGSQFWDRLLYLATDPSKRYRSPLAFTSSISLDLAQNFNRLLPAKSLMRPVS